MQTEKIKGIQIVDDYAKVPLSQGKYAIIDTEDIDKINHVSWVAHREHRDGNYYANSMQWDFEKKKQFSIKMHRIIMDAKPGEIIDHIDHN